VDPLEMLDESSHEKPQIGCWFRDFSLQTISGPNNRTNKFNDLRTPRRQPFLTPTSFQRVSDLRRWQPEQR
jgi:hypothetical protein